jgi:large subunit ribosomal protein L6
MSKIGKVPVDIPGGVQVSVDQAAKKISVKGPKGTLTFGLVDGISAKIDGQKVVIERVGDERFVRAMHGTTRAQIKNMIEGVTKGYSRKLEVVGVGYKAILQGKKLALTVGYANTIEVEIPAGVTITTPDQTHIEVTGIDKQLVGQVACTIRKVRKPEPYKGKGVRYADEVVRKKAGKSAAAGGAGAKK